MVCRPTRSVAKKAALPKSFRDALIRIGISPNDNSSSENCFVFQKTRLMRIDNGSLKRV